MEKELNIKWTMKLEVIPNDGEPQRQMIFEGVDEDGEKVRVYVKKIEKITENNP